MGYEPLPTAPGLTGRSADGDTTGAPGHRSARGKAVGYLAGLGLFCFGFLGVLAFLSMRYASDRSRPSRPPRYALPG